MKLHIAIPAYQRKVDIGVLGSICALLSEWPAWEISLDYEDSSVITIARNNLVRRFLQTEAEWLLFWDNDIVPGSFILQMLETAETLYARIVSAPIVQKHNGLLNCGFVRNDLVEHDRSLSTPALRDVAGTGLMLIHRSVFDVIQAPWFEFIHHADYELGEDYNFCLKAREQGINIAVDPRISTTHYGVAGWQYQLAKTIAA